MLLPSNVAQMDRNRNPLRVTRFAFAYGTYAAIQQGADRSRPAPCRPEQEPEVVAEIMSSRADCLFIGMPTPRKERFLAKYRDQLGVPFIMGVGGSFDVLAGYVKRAPPFMQAAGLEWLYRIYQEPRRMWWRYMRTNALFAATMVRAILQRALVGR